MRRNFSAALCGLALLATVGSAYALRIAGPGPMPTRIGQADAVLVGKVTSIEAKTVKAERYQGDNDKGEYQIAVIKVNEALLGGEKGVTHIKVGFLPPVGGGEGGVDERPIRRPIRPGFGSPKLEKDQEALLFLKAHHKEGFYIIQQSWDVVDAKAANYKNSVEEVKKLTKIINDPMESLKAKEAKDRFQAAAVLVNYYRSGKAGPTKQEEIAADQSKLILEALAEANWDAPRIGGFQLHPQQTFFMLGLQETDGWKQPQDFTQFPNMAKAWLKDNAGKYKIKRFVSTKEEKK